MQYKTPGVYIEEISIFPPSVASVETAIPAFIGHTEKALDADGQSLSNIPTKINSLVEFEQHFGAAHQPAAYEVTLSSFSVSAIAVEKYYLYQSMQLYFSNGGGPCYIVSVGSYSDDLDPVNFNTGLNALVKYDEPTLILFPDAVGVNEDGTQLGVAELGALQANTLAQCAKLQDRFGVFDLRNGDSDANTVVQNFRENIGINNLRYGAAYYPFLDTSLPADIPLRLILESSNPITDLDVSPLNPSTAQSTLVSDMQTAISNTNTVGLSGFNYLDLLDIKAHLLELQQEIRNGIDVDDNINEVLDILRQAVLSFQAIRTNLALTPDFANKITSLLADTTLALTTQTTTFVEIELNASIPGTAVEIAGGAAAFYASLEPLEWLGGNAIADLTEDAVLDLSGATTDGEERLLYYNYLVANVDFHKILDSYQALFNIALLQEQVTQDLLIAGFPFFDGVKKAVEKEMRLVPPSGAIVGVYAKVDDTRGVWKAPANVGLAGVAGPSVKLTNVDQDDLNVDTTAGKSINAIRSFTGKGTLVWGARTLAGNDNEWRYVSVRRLFNMVEESIQKASSQFVFEPNDANTWVKIRSMISNYLTTLWRQGALAGPTPDAAFFVKVGLGETMTAQDILEGRMIIEIGMAAVRPAEFIILKFSHKMQEA